MLFVKVLQLLLARRLYLVDEFGHGHAQHLPRDSPFETPEIVPALRRRIEGCILRRNTQAVEKEHGYVPREQLFAQRVEYLCRRDALTTGSTLLEAGGDPLEIRRAYAVVRKLGQRSIDHLVGDDQSHFS